MKGDCIGLHEDWRLGSLVKVFSDGSGKAIQFFGVDETRNNYSYSFDNYNNHIPLHHHRPPHLLLLDTLKYHSVFPIVYVQWIPIQVHIITIMIKLLYPINMSLNIILRHSV